MNELFDILERHNLITVENLDNISQLPGKKLEKLYQQIYSFIYKAQTTRIWGNQSSAPTDTFSFHASASIRGASGCSEIGCRIKKLDFLGRYAALYATELTLPLSMVAPERVEGISSMRDLLAENVLAFFHLRPLITEGIVVPVVMRTAHCIHEIEWVKTMTFLVHDFSEVAAKALLSDFRLIYQIPKKSLTGLPTLYMYGPEDYIEHGELVKLYKQPPRWISKTARFDKLGQVEVTGPHKRHIITHIFSEIADNMTFYLAYGTRRNARFLSDMQGETDFLDWVTEDEQMTAKSVALHELHHSVPLLGDLAIGTILRIRKQERNSFQAYRDTIARVSSTILSSSSRISKKQAREMFRTAIEPEIHRINREILTHRKSQSRRTLSGLATLAAGILIGAFAGLPPLISVPLVGATTLVGGRLLSKAAESACEHGPELKQKNDLYFLLRLANEL